MSKKIKSLKKSVRNAFTKFRNPINVLQDNKGATTTVEIIAIIIIVLVILTIVFFPQLKTIFTTTIMPGITNQITGLFSLK